jgi:hypothetical protein
MRKICPSVLAALVVTALLAAPAAAAPGKVAVRIEGDAQTLLPRTVVTTTETPVGKPGQPTCSGTSALGAVELATKGNWSGPYDAGFQSYNVKLLMGETHDDATSSYWAFWINYTYASLGVCGQQTQEGDDVLFVPECYAAGCSPTSPLRISGLPRTVAPGKSVTVRVDAYTAPVFPSTTTTVAPAAGATISYGDNAATTGSDGTARLTFSGVGEKTVQATKPGYVRSASETTCLTSGDDGRCGTDDEVAPAVSFRKLKTGQVYERKRAPRRIAGSVTSDPSGLRAVRLGIARKLGDRCWGFSGAKERFKRRGCDDERKFRIGDRQVWSYLLPERLPKGRYQIRAVAVDNAGNRSARRVVIRVR